MQIDIKNLDRKKILLPISIDTEKAKKQKLKKLIEIEGIEIYFPYEPYLSQKTYMKNIFLKLNKEKSLSGLESPTGTGKTLCLLCAVLAWVKHNENEISIYY